MKSIEERAREYVEPIYGVDSYSEGDEIYSAFCDGADSEHKELTKWNNPRELPNHENQVLCKLKAGGYKLIRKDSNQGVFIDLKTYMIIWPEDLIGWREIHE